MLWVSILKLRIKRHGGYSRAAIQAGQIGFSVLRDREKQGQNTLGMSRRQDTTDLHISQGENLSVLDLMVKPGNVCQGVTGLVNMGIVGLFTQELGIHPTDRQLCAIHFCKLFRRAEMIKMTVGMQDPAHIPGVKAGTPDAVHQQMACAQIAGIDQDQTVTGVDQVNTALLVAYTARQQF